MKWKKLGKVFCPDGSVSWMNSHAAVPIAEHIEKNLFRIYFSSRDIKNRSRIGFVVIDITNPKNIINISSSEVLPLGDLGTFDDSGTMATWLTKKDNTRYLYYIGWNLGVTVPFRNSIGLATEKNDGNFTKYSKGPILDRTVNEPHFCASCCVIPDGDLWRMWYLSCTGWTKKNNVAQHHYHIKYAESNDGINWKREGVIAIDYAEETEFAISRPSVIKEDDCWKIWYSFRGESYRIGYAESEDGKNWERLDHLAGIDVSAKGWDSEMIEYPFVFDHEGQKYMLYNGNGYGETGFGIAILEQE